MVGFKCSLLMLVYLEQLTIQMEQRGLVHPPMPRPVALLPHLPSELLTYILAQESYPTTLIICSTRAAFLSALLELIPPSHSPPPAPPSLHHGSTGGMTLHESPEGVDGPGPAPAGEEPRTLLTPTLHQLSVSRHITTVFVPTLSHLRAYLAVFPPPSFASSCLPAPLAQKARDTGTAPHPLLAIYGLVKLHKGTSEWSAQGLGCSAAALVEAGWRAEARTVLIEDDGVENEVLTSDEADVRSELVSHSDDHYARDEGAPVPGNEKGRQRNVEYWREKVPMLSGSVRRSGAELEYGGRTVEVGSVLRKWFQLGSGDGVYA